MAAESNKAKQNFMDQEAERKEKLALSRARTKELQTEFAGRGDVLGWFDALYAGSGGNNELIPWADLEPNSYLQKWAESTGLEGNGRTALVVGCGLGDDALFLHDRGFKVTAFDISGNAIDWARRLHAEKDIRFEVADLFKPPADWKYGASGDGFDFVLEIYTIQPLPLEMRPQVIEAIAGFVGENGRLLVVTRGREDDETPDEVPWPVSRRDLSRFGSNGLRQADFIVMEAQDEDEPDRFVVEYVRDEAA
jgi:SAM-dependent methyltransferase